MNQEFYKSHIQNAEQTVGKPLPFSNPSLEADCLHDLLDNWGIEKFYKGQSFIVEENVIVKRYSFQSQGIHCYAFSKDSYDNKISTLKGLREELEKIGEVILEGGVDKDGNYIATDILLYDGNDLTDKPLRKRKEILAIALEDTNIRPAEYSIFYHEDCLLKGGQGSGCSGSNCGRPSTGGGSGRFATDPIAHADKIREKISILKEKFKQRRISPRTYKRSVEPLYALLQRTEMGSRESQSKVQVPYERGKSYIVRLSNSIYSFSPTDDYVIMKGGEGSGCQGPNCGRPATGRSPRASKRGGVSAFSARQLTPLSPMEKVAVIDKLRTEKKNVLITNKPGKDGERMAGTAEMEFKISKEDVKEPQKFTIKEEFKNKPFTEAKLKAPKIAMSDGKVELSSDKEHFKNLFFESLQQYPEPVQEIIAPAIEQVTVINIDSPDGANTLAMYVPTTANSNRGLGIEINERGLERAKNQVNTKMVMTHEIAHALDHAIQKKIGTRFSETKLWANTAKKDPLISSYSKANLREHFAEAVTAFLYIPDKLREFAPRTYKVLDTLFKEKGNVGIAKKFYKHMEDTLDIDDDNFDDSLVKFLSNILNDENEKNMSKGGPGSGCHGPNCGRPSTGGATITPHKEIGQHAIPPLDGERKWIDHVEGMTTDTLKEHTNPDGTLKPERLELHKKIKEKYLSSPPKVSDDQIPIAVVLMDGPASGKSHIVEALDKGDFVRIDPDSIREQLPEYQEGIKMGARDSALITHSEASLLAKQIQEQAISNKQNVIFDGTGKNAEKYEKMIKGMRDNGYKVDVIMPTIPKEVAKQRAEARARITGRVVPEFVIDEAYDSMPKNFERIAKVANTFKLYDNITRIPRLVYAHDEQGGTKIYDEAFVTRFKEQAK